MLKIGFANKYFTLWNVTMEKAFANCGGVFVPYNHTNFNFVRNLSMNEEEALKKAVLLGCNDLHIDEDLRGKSGSFTVKETFPKVDTVNSPVFEFGKYKNEKISMSEDEKYLFYYFAETQNVHAKERLLLKFGFIDFEGQLISLEQFDSLRKTKAVQDSIRTAKEGVGRMISNLTTEGTGRIEIDGETVYLQFSEFKMMQYNGIQYGLPVVSGKGKKVKGKTIHFKLTDGIEVEGMEGLFCVESFKFLEEEKIY